MTFEQLNISEPVLRALNDKQYEIPTAIQQQAIPVASAGEDLLGIAQTGTGKTAAFAIPIIEQLMKAQAESEQQNPIKEQQKASSDQIESDNIESVSTPLNRSKDQNNKRRKGQAQDRTQSQSVEAVDSQSKNEGKNRRQKSGKEEGQAKRPIRALILTPTRELAIQIEESFADYGKYTSLRHTVIYGGVNQNPQVAALRRGTDILIATPGRLLDLIGQGFIHLNDIKYFVLDEADRMLDMGFIHDIRRLIPMLPKQKQTMLFSATMPTEIASISRSLQHNPKRVEVAPAASVVDTIEQHLFFVEKPQKASLLIDVLKKEVNKSVLVFSRTKHGADKIARLLNKQKINCEAIHGNKSQNARQTALNNFKSGKTRIIVATDIAARGIDIENLGLVINYDLPDVAETYVHRIGRTGRAGHEGLALSFCTEEEIDLVNNIQKLTGKRLDSVLIPA